MKTIPIDQIPKKINHLKVDRLVRYWTVQPVFPHIITQLDSPGACKAFITLEAAFKHRWDISPEYAAAHQARLDLNSQTHSKATCY